MADWIKIKNEYINGDISQRKLAEKHGVPYSTLRHRAAKENWIADKESQRIKMGTKLAQKTAEKISDIESDRMAKIMTLADDAIDILQKALKQTTSTKKVETYRLRQIVQSIKDLKDIVKIDPRDNSDTEIADDGFIDALNAKAGDIDWSDDE